MGRRTTRSLVGRSVLIGVVWCLVRGVANRSNSSADAVASGDVGCWRAPLADFGQLVCVCAGPRAVLCREPTELSPHRAGHVPAEQCPARWLRARQVLALKWYLLLVSVV